MRAPFDVIAAGRKSRELREGPAFGGRRDSLFGDHHVYGLDGTN